MRDMADTFEFEDLKGILINRIGVDAADIPDDPQTSFESVGLDSLAIMEIQLEVEQRYGFTVSEEDAAAIRTFDDAISYVQGRLSETA
jgi:acyl carrier protein